MCFLFRVAKFLREIPRRNCLQNGSSSNGRAYLRRRYFVFTDALRIPNESFVVFVVVRGDNDNTGNAHGRNAVTLSSHQRNQMSQVLHIACGGIRERLI